MFARDLGKRAAALRGDHDAGRVVHVGDAIKRLGSQIGAGRIEGFNLDTVAIHRHTMKADAQEIREAPQAGIGEAFGDDYIAGFGSGKRSCSVMYER